MNKELEDIESILYEALNRVGVEEREAYLEDACGSNAQLRAEIDSLLLAYESEKGVLKEPSDLVEEPVRTLTESPGTTIDRYKLLEQIGEGGMAVVYMAEQQEPIRRKVALKIIKLGMDTRQVIARFEVERQALAMMDHPNIAKILDAGATETGRPYFVMDLVKGLLITEYCDKNRLSTRERLDLFIQVCNAVQHAHQKGIIHRDIKPSNVLVTSHDGKPVPRIIDFGIAKATSKRLTERTMFTRYAQLIGTPAYMSPEQAELTDLDIDTRADIYSLGVLLYELLTGTTPFTEEELRESGYDGMQRIIREKEPAKPSTRLTTLAATHPEVAECRKAAPEALAKLIRGDLDWIVMKALEKDRTRRYETVSGMAEDVGRHLNSEPVLAAAPSALYRAQKFVRRHRVGVVAGSVVIAVLLVGMTGTTIGFVQAKIQKRQALANIQKAHDNLMEMNTLVWREEAGVSDTERFELHLEMFQKSLTFLEWSLAEIGDNPDVRSKIGDANKNIGVINLSCFNKPEAAELAYRRATSVFEELVTDFPDRSDFRTQLGYCKNGLAAVLEALGRSREAKEEYRASLRLLESLPSPLSLDIPVNLGAVVNSEYDEVCPSMSGDGLRLFFSSNRPDGLGSWDLWMAMRQSVDDPFEAPMNLGAKVNSSSWDDGPSISQDGLTLYFCSTRGGGFGGFDLWKATRETQDGEWSASVNLGMTVNTEYLDSVPSISADGLSLYFHSNRPGGFGGKDIWLAKRSSLSEQFSEPENLGPGINSPYSEHTPSISPDGLMLFFACLRPEDYTGSYDLWAAKRSITSEPFGSPMSLGPLVNGPVSETCPRLSADGSLLLFSSQQPGGQGSWDLWQAPVLPTPKSVGRSNDLRSVKKTVKDIY